MTEHKQVRCKGCGRSLFSLMSSRIGYCVKCQNQKRIIYRPINKNNLRDGEKDIH